MKGRRDPAQRGRICLRHRTRERKRRKLTVGFGLAIRIASALCSICLPLDVLAMCLFLTALISDEIEEIMSSR